MAGFENGSGPAPFLRLLSGKALFSLGVVVGTPGAGALLRRLGISPLLLICRHAVGDWGQIDPADRGLNEAAIPNQGRIMSVYRFGSDVVWVITDPGHETTTVLLPEEY